MRNLVPKIRGEPKGLRLRDDGCADGVAGAGEGDVVVGEHGRVRGYEGAVEMVRLVGRLLGTIRGSHRCVAWIPTRLVRERWEGLRVSHRPLFQAE